MNIFKRKPKLKKPSDYDWDFMYFCCKMTRYKQNVRECYKKYCERRFDISYEEFCKHIKELESKDPHPMELVLG